MDIWTAVSLLAFYLGDLNILAARFAGTCTQGDAGRLYGVIYSILFYSAAIFFMRKSGRERTILLIVSPLLPIFVWQTLFSFRLSYELLWIGASACDVLEGMSLSYPADGGEIIFAISWPLMAIAVVIGILAVWMNRASSGAETAPYGSGR